MPEVFSKKLPAKSYFFTSSNLNLAEAQQTSKMRRIFIISFLTLLLNFAAIAQNQPVVADKTDEYYKILTAAYDKLKAAPYRETFRQTNELKSGSVTITYTTVTEVITPDKKRQIKTTVYTYPNTARIVDTIGFPRDMRLEIIAVGDLEYEKEDNKGWKQLKRKNFDRESQETDQPNHTIIFLGRKIIDGKRFDVYEITQTKNVSQPKSRCWINADNGLLTKIDYDSIENKDTVHKVEITFEQDASIKIEAPNLN